MQLNMKINDSWSKCSLGGDNWVNYLFWPIEGLGLKSNASTAVLPSTSASVFVNFWTDSHSFQQCLTYLPGIVGLRAYNVRWLRIVLQLHSNIIFTVVFSEWIPRSETKCRGGPEKRWDDIFIEIAGVDWMSKALAFDIQSTPAISLSISISL